MKVLSPFKQKARIFKSSNPTYRCANSGMCYDVVVGELQHQAIPLHSKELAPKGTAPYKSHSKRQEGTPKSKAILSYWLNHVLNCSAKHKLTSRQDSLAYGFGQRLTCEFNLVVDAEVMQSITPCSARGGFMINS